jgi:site-specific DNA-methyltransferase (adenine-specific)
LNGGKQMKNVWKMPPPSSYEKAHGKHPTQKPVALIARCLQASTNRGDVVLDPFAGSATTGVAAIRLERSFLGCERDEGYVRLAIKRLGGHTGRGEEIAPEDPAEPQDLFSGLRGGAHAD